MEPKNEQQLMPNMIMCGDHPSITKTELSAREPRPEERDKDVKKFISYGRITPTASHTDKQLSRSRAASEHALRGEDARRRARALQAAERADVDVPGNTALVQAAIGSFRWPPYLLCVWVLVLVLTHALHCLVSVLERTLPTLRKFCQYFRVWTEESWKSETDLNHRVYPIALACVTGVLYALYGTLCVLLAAAVWAVEPLCTDEDTHEEAPKITNYIELPSSDLNQ